MRSREPMPASPPSLTRRSPVPSNHADAPPGVLHVQGEGSLVTEYDKVKVQITLTVHTEGVNTASVAQTQGQDLTRDFIIACVDELRVPNDGIATKYVSVHPVRKWETGSSNRSKVVGYTASSSIEVDVSTEDKTLVPKIYALASRFELMDGAELSVGGLRPYVSDELRKMNFEDLFASAMEDAKWKARLYAEAAGRPLGPVLVMSDKPIQVQAIRPEMMPRAKAMAYGGEQMMMARGGAPGGHNDGPPEIQLGKGEKLKLYVHIQYQLL